MYKLGEVMQVASENAHAGERGARQATLLATCAEEM
jgi:hypothetical protein